MRVRTLVAAVVTLACAVLTASCLRTEAETEEPDATGQAPALETEPTGEAALPAYEDTFHFYVDVRDDGEGRAGGWQKADATLKFGDWRHPLTPYFWQCRLTVGMPIRTERQGRIPARFAAQVTAEAATEVAHDVMHSRETWMSVTSLYCKALATGMQAMLNGPQYQLGARVTSP